MTKTKPASMKQAAEQILTEAGGPLRSDEITKRALDAKLIRTKGRTPQSTMAAQLAVASKDKGSPFIRTAPATYGLRGRDREVQRAS